MLESKIKEAISEAFQVLYDHRLETDAFTLQPTRKEFDGSYTFVTFPYLKVTRKNPEESGNALGAWLKQQKDFVADFNVVKGFLNLVPSDNAWVAELESMGDTAGVLPSNGRKVMVEFSSPNTNKPLHLGHLRNNFLGDSVSRILKASGCDVLKVNLVNDRGIHICKSMLAYQKYGNGETPESSGLKGDHLIGKYYVEFDKVYKEEIKKLVDEGKDPETAKKTAPSIVEAQEMLQKWEQG